MRLRGFLSSRGVRLRDEDRGPRPVFDYDVETESEIHLILEELWLRVAKPIIDGLKFSVSFLSIHNIPFCSLFAQVSCSVEPTSDLVVSHRTPCIPPPSCRRNL